MITSQEAYNIALNKIKEKILNYIFKKIKSSCNYGYFNLMLKCNYEHNIDTTQAEIIRDILINEYGYSVDIEIHKYYGLVLNINWNNMKNGTFISPNGNCVLGWELNDNKELYAGYISNSGCNKQWIIEYDDNFTIDENLQMLYEYIYKHYE